MSRPFFRRAGLGAGVFVCLFISLAPSLAQAETSICVEVRQKSWSTPKPDTKAEAKPSQAWAYAARPPETEKPAGLDPAAYLKRMLEYEVTHEPGYHSTSSGCAQRLQVELYPLGSGFTVFARYSGFAREEKVDQVEIDEFPQLAERLAYALLRDRPVEETITRENVLRADSEHAYRTIRTRGHALFALGTSVRVGKLHTATDDPAAPAERETRVLTPVSFQLGYRGKFKAWGIDVFGRLSLGSRERSADNNELGGHVDFEGAAGTGLHFLRYLDSAGMTSLYFGGGASFDLPLFSLIRPDGARKDGDRDYIVSAGLDLDLVVGYEFLRASSLHFFAQAELHVPTYVLSGESASGGVQSYMPGGLAQIGSLF